MNINPNEKVFLHFEPNFYEEEEHMWNPHVSVTIFFHERLQKKNFNLKKVSIKICINL